MPGRQAPCATPPWGPRGEVPIAGRCGANGCWLPGYLHKYYWWAYVHRNAVRVFERQWLVNAILWGNTPSSGTPRSTPWARSLPGRTLQIACAYGDISNQLRLRVEAGSGALDVVDVLPTQLENLRGIARGGAGSGAADGFRRAAPSRRQLRPRPTVFPAARATRGLAAQDPRGKPCAS